MDPSPSRRLLLLVLGISALVYLPSLLGGYVWDDHHLVEMNRLTGSLAHLPQLFRTDLWASAPSDEGTSGYYRPLLLVSLALERSLFGLSPVASRAQDLLWHLGAVVLLWRLLSRLSLPAPAVATGTALFALHPAQVEAVCFTGARNDPMCTVLLLGMVAVLDRDRVSAGRLAGGALLACGALLSKELALVAPLVLALWAFARTGRPGTTGAHGAVVVGLLVAVALRRWAGVGWPSSAAGSQVLEILPVAGTVMARKVLLPVDLSPGIHLGWPPPVTPVFLILAFGVAALALLGGRGAAAGLGLFMVALAPTFLGMALHGNVGDRYLHLPLAGLALAAAALLARIPRLRWGAVPLLALLALLSSRQVPLWHDDVVLWTATTDRSPSPYTFGALGKALQETGDLEGARLAYRRAVQGPVPFPHACYNVVGLELERDDPAAAVEAGEAALKGGCPPVPEILGPLSVALAVLGRWDEAEAVALRVDPDPTGLTGVVRAAAGWRRGEVPAETAPAFRERVAWLLTRAGEGERGAGLAP